MADHNSIFTGDQIDEAVDAVLYPVLKLVSKTASFNFTATEQNAIVNASSSSAIVATIQPDSVLNLPIGTVLMMRRVGTGAASFVAGSGVTLEAGNGLSITAQYRYGTAIKMDTDKWSVVC